MLIHVLKKGELSEARQWVSTENIKRTLGVTYGEGPAHSALQAPGRSCLNRAAQLRLDAY